MNDLRICSTDLQAVRDALLHKDVEQCAVLLCNRLDGLRSALLVRDVLLPAETDYARRTRTGAELSPQFVAGVAKRAKQTGASVVFVHTHPGTAPPLFSRTDTNGERHLTDFLQRRGLHGLHGALVISHGGLRARHLGAEAELRVVSIGDHLTIEFDPCANDDVGLPMFDRQIRAFGKDGQRALSKLRVAIVGVGGTGSIVAQQLAHLGVRDFILIDPDCVETTNLNRVVGAGPGDVGLTKVDTAARNIHLIADAARVHPVQGDVVHASIATELRAADFIFCCTDSHGSRSVVQQLAYQYLIPCIDVGSTITTSDGGVTGIFGRVQLLGPGQACLWCSRLLDANQVRIDMMSAFERKLDPYIPGAREPAPAVISLNGTVVSLGITMFLGVVTAVPIQGRYLIYNATASSLRAVRAAAQPDCFICSRRGALAGGDRHPLFARQD